VVGSKYGNLFVLDVQTGKGEKIIGKHQECIICGSWILHDQILVLGSSERLISFTNIKTLETIKVLHLQEEPKQIIVGKTCILPDITYAIVSVLTNTNLVLVECSMMDGIISLDNTRYITFEKKSGKPLLQSFFNHFSSIFIAFESGTFISLQLTSFTNQKATLFDAVCNHGTLGSNSALTDVVVCAKAQTLVTYGT
jgi:WD40 repeat protein